MRTTREHIVTHIFRNGKASNDDDRNMFVSMLLKVSNTVVSNHINSDHVPSFSCLDI